MIVSSNIRQCKQKFEFSDLQYTFYQCQLRMRSGFVPVKALGKIQGLLSPEFLAVGKNLTCKQQIQQANMEKGRGKSLKRSRSRVCSVVGCSNGDYKLSKWKDDICEIHNIAHDACSCEPPFK